MKDNYDGQEVVNRLIEWANQKPDIRALLITSSHTNPRASLDEFSDYDIIVVVNDIQPYLNDESWLEDFGRVLVLYRDPIQSEYGFEKFIRVTQYEDGLKIDFTLWPVGLLKRVAAEPELPGYLDDGCRVILDKDGLAKGMKAPTYHVFVPCIPTEAEYQNFVEGFFSNAPYVAKHIRRDDYFPLKSVLHYMRYEKMRKLLEWRVEIDYNWSLKTGFYGKGLSQYLDPEILEELENTCVGHGAEANWNALFGIIKLFRKVAREVGQHLDYAYPEDLEHRVIKYLLKVKEGEKG